MKGESENYRDLELERDLRRAQNESDNKALLDRLGTLDPISYDQERIAAAEKLGVRAETLDKEVRRKRPKADEAALQGSQLLFKEPEPWPEPVDGAACLDEIVKALKTYIVLPQATPEVIALWISHAHAFNAFYYTPRLALLSPEKQCGKTITLDVVEHLTPRAIRTENVTTAALFRVIEQHQPTVLIDEGDTFLHNEELRGLLNAGHRKGGCHMRCEGDKNEVRTYSTFAPVAIAKIGKLHGTLADRSIPIQMRRRLSSEKINEFRADHAEHILTLKRKVIRWAADNLSALSESDPAMPEWLFNRSADKWRPLFAIADLCGEDWAKQARDAAQILEKIDATDEGTAREMLLYDIRELFEKEETDRLPSALIVTELVKMEDRPWPEFGKKQNPITAPKVARLLDPFGIKPTTIRFEGSESKKGYYRHQFKDAFAQFLGDQSVTALQVKETAASSDFSSVTQGPDVTDRDESKAAEKLECNGVTGREVGVSRDMSPRSYLPPEDDPEREAIMSEQDYAST